MKNIFNIVSSYYSYSYSKDMGGAVMFKNVINNR
jgi:hypothetical protein